MAGRKAKKRSYSDEQKAEALVALDANGGDVAKTARATKIPRGTLQHWATRRGTHPDVRHLAQGKKADLADRIEDLARSLLDAAPAKVAGASLQQVVVAIGVAVDKMRLLRDQPTSITSHELSDAERMARLASLADRARARRDEHLACAGGASPLVPYAGQGREEKPPAGSV